MIFLHENIELKFKAVFLVLVFSGLACKTVERPPSYRDINSGLLAGNTNEAKIFSVECLAATTVYTWDENDLSMLSEAVTKPLQARASGRFLSPLYIENYSNVCGRARAIAQRRAEKYISSQEDPERFDARDNTLINPGSDQIPWPKNDSFDLVIEEGRCQCRRVETTKFNKKLFCAREYQFDINKKNGESLDERCLGFSVSKVSNFDIKRYSQMGADGYCQDVTQKWRSECEKGQESFADSNYAKNNLLKLGKCLSQNVTIPVQRCVCSPTVISANDFGERDFSCSRKTDVGFELLNLDSKSGD